MTSSRKGTLAFMAVAIFTGCHWNWSAVDPVDDGAAADVTSADSTLADGSPTDIVAIDVPVVDTVVEDHAMPAPDVVDIGVDTFTCHAIGTACGMSSDCCSHRCEASICREPADAATDIGPDTACRPAHESCTEASQCCSHSCAGTCAE